MCVNYKLNYTMDFRVSMFCLSLLLGLLLIIASVNSKYIQVPNSKIDVGFGHLDKNDDGVVDPDEFARLINTDDKDGDGCVSKVEYENGAEAAHALSDLMFGYFDTDGTGCLTNQTMQREFTKADQDGGGQISAHEWETYFQQLMKQLFSSAPKLPGIVG